MVTSEKGIALIKSFEGCKLTAYLCPSGIPTIGYGHTGRINNKPIKVGMKIKDTTAVKLLKADIKKFEHEVKKYPGYEWTQNEFDALVSFAYNIGSINQLTDYGTRSKAVIAEKMLRYNHDAKGNELRGLTKRREAEQKLFLTK